MTATQWPVDRVRNWVAAQSWYQTIPVVDGIVTPGSVDSRLRMELLDLPASLKGKSVLDVGCNSGMYCFECADRGASPVVGIDVNRERLIQARTLAEIKGATVRFENMDLLEASELGPFDIVLCFAVLTEVPDLIGAMLALGQLTRQTLFLEIGVLRDGRARFRWPVPRPLGAIVARALFRQPVAQLSRTKQGWSWVPETRLCTALLGDRFSARDLGSSVRYRLLRFDRRPS